MLDNRLRICASMVSGDGIVCDVGTDHALLAAELIMTKKCLKVIASDIKEGPLEFARKTVEKYDISDKVELVLSDGLEKVCLDGVTDIVIAGMGGETIVNILKNRIDELDGIHLILQPMSKPEILRKWLYFNNFQAVTEKTVDDGDKIYSVILAEKDISEHYELTEFGAIAGFFDEEDYIGTSYVQKESARLAKIAQSLKKAGKNNDAVHCSAMSRRLLEGNRKVSINEIYKLFDEKYPFRLQEKWDNSGFLINSGFNECQRVMLTLDITNDVILEAANKKADLIISHHPVIFNPLRKIDSHDPVYNLIEHGISAICMHTNLDIAEGGTNTVIFRNISESVDISDNVQTLEESGLGYIAELRDAVDINHFSDILKKIFKTEHIKVNIGSKKNISKIAICSGSGGSLAGLAMEKGCDTLITGDVKHDVWIDANNHNFTIFDCGHFHTENIVLWELRRVLEEKFPLLDVEISENSVDPCIYI